MEVLKDFAAPRQEPTLLLSQTEDTRPWVTITELLWNARRLIAIVTLAALLISTAIAFLLPKHYESTTRIMPPEQPNGGAAMLAALAGRAVPGAMSALAGNLFGLRNNGALFVDLLQSQSVQEHLVDQFDLQKVYSNRYRMDALKKLARRTEITEDRKSGVITIVVTDTNQRRARDLAQAYLDQLDSLLARVNTSAARRERQFIEQRLVTVQSELERSQLELSEFSSKNTTLDIKEQTRAMVEAGAKLQAQMIVARSELESLEQIYGNDNVRVRAARSRVGELQSAIARITGPSSPSAANEEETNNNLFPPLRQLPALSVGWANLYRRVKINETVYDLLSEEYETARIEEAKAIPSVSVIDYPTWPEKKSFPPRRLIIAGATLLTAMATGLALLLRKRWHSLAQQDPRKRLAETIWLTIQSDSRRLYRPLKGLKLVGSETKLETDGS